MNSRRNRMTATLTGLALVIAAVASLTGCSLQPTGVSDGGEAPTGIAAGPTLYFIGEDGALVAQPRDARGLGTMAEALALLFAGPGDSDLRTDIPEQSTGRVGVTVTGHVIELTIPLAEYEVTPSAIDQIVCTALASHAGHGGSQSAAVRTLFTISLTDRNQLRTCQLLDVG